MSDHALCVWSDEGDVELMEGDPATVVTRLAHETGATMTVFGLGRHCVTDRIFGDETALRFIRTADVPVLAVAERDACCKAIPPRSSSALHRASTPI